MPLATDGFGTLFKTEGGGGGGGSPLTQVIYVDPAGSDTTGDGGIGNPYQTIQKAHDVIPASGDSGSVRKVWVIQVSPGTYDEDLTINITHRHIAIVGVFNLGTFAAGTWNPSGTARNITVTVTAGNIDSIRHTFMLGSGLGLGGGSSTHRAYNTRPRVSGRIIVNDAVVGGTTKEVYLSCLVHDFAAVGRSLEQVGTGFLNLYCEESSFATQVYGTNVRLQLARGCTFTGLLWINNYSRIEACRITSGITIVQDVADLQPSGMVNTNFAGTFTGPVSSCRMDANTHYWFGTNSATLAGGATKFIQDAPPGYNITFTNADLTGGVLKVTHDLAQQYVTFAIYDDNNESVVATATAYDENTLLVDLSGFSPISSTWKAVIR